MQLPFLQRMLGEFTLVPLATGAATKEEVAEVLERLWGGPETLVVISTETSADPFVFDAEAFAGLRLVDAMTGETFDVPASGSLTLPMAALSYRFLLTEGDPCISN